MKRVALAVAGILLLSGCSRLKTSDDQDSTRAPKDGVAFPAELQLDYAILLDDPSGTKRINEKYRFHSGDRFRIELRPHFNAHVYIVNRGPQQASYSFLYPSPNVARQNPVGENTVVTLPSGTDWYSLDNRSGIENVVMIVASSPLAEFNTPERSIARDECEDRLALLERDYRATSSRRFEDRDWTKLFAAKGDRTAIILRLPLDHR